MPQEAYPGSTSSLHDRNKVVFHHPQWMIDFYDNARSNFAASSPPGDDRNISQIQARGENPMETLYGVSGEESARYAASPYNGSSATHYGSVFASSSATSLLRGNAVEEPPLAGDTGAVEDEVRSTYTSKPLPEWYEALSNDSVDRGLRRPTTDTLQALRSMDAFRDCIRRCETSAAAKPAPEREALFNELRDHIHKAEITLKGMNKFVVRKKRLLGEENALPCIFEAKNVAYPWDLQADACQLYLRWYDQDFVPNIFRGIIEKNGKNRTGDRIDPTWRNNASLGTSANYHGQGNLVLGQWWPTQLCAVRDRAHGASQGGIWGAKGQGAFSIIMSAGAYEDEDQGDEIWYSGTDTKTDQPTEMTQRLMESCDLFPDRPVRVLRSMQLPLTNPYRPNVGIRYDGLYKVVGMEQPDRAKENYKFKLVRCENQHPIRYQNDAARRPTKYEEAEYRRLQVQGR